MSDEPQQYDQPAIRSHASVNIVLTGFMAVGKTTIGRRVARRLGRAFYDADAEIVKRTGMQVTEIFTHCGETRFRKLESTVCRWLAAREGAVISTGGGMVVNPANLAALSRTGLVICLNASPEVLRVRLARNKARPLAQNWERLYEQRKAAYAAAPYQINTDGKSPEYVAMEIVRLWQSYP
jgi:shikimate kinase